MRLRNITLAACLTTALLGLVGCNTYDDGGVEGRVVDKDRKSQKIGKSTTYKYELDIVDAEGTEHEIRVEKSVYDDCYNGSAYPRCKDR